MKLLTALLTIAITTAALGQFDPTKPTDVRRWDKADDDIRANFAALTAASGYGAVFNVTDSNYGAVGDGSDDEAAIEAAEAAADDNGGILFFPTTGNAYKFLTAIEISENVTVRFAPGASLMGDGSSTFTNNGAYEDTKHQIFQSTMTPDTFGKNTWIRPEWFGVVPGQSQSAGVRTENAAAYNRAIAAAGTARRKLKAPLEVEYTGALTSTAATHILGAGYNNITGPSDYAHFIPYITDGSNAFEASGFTGLTLDSVYFDGTNSDGSGIDLDTMVRVELKHVVARAFSTAGKAGLTLTKIARMNAAYCGFTNNYNGVLQYGGSGGYINNVTWTSCEFEQNNASGWGVDISGTGLNFISPNIEGQTNGIRIGNVFNSAGVLFDLVYSESVTNSITLNGCSDVSLRSPYLSTGTLATSITNCTNVNISGFDGGTLTISNSYNVDLVNCRPGTLTVTKSSIRHRNGEMDFFPLSTMAGISTGAFAAGQLGNLMPNSEDLTGWVETTITSTANDAVAPDGSTTADHIDATSAGGYITQNTGTITSVPTGTSVFVSLYALKDDASVALDIQLWAWDAAAGPAAYVNIGQFSPTTSTTEWNRYVYSATTGAYNSTKFQVRLRPAGSTGTGAHWLWGLQINTGSLKAYTWTGTTLVEPVSAPGTIFSDTIAMSGAPQALTGAGAINATTSITEYTSDGGAQALTISDGITQGQFKTVMHVVDGGSGVLTGANLIGTSVTFTDDGESCTLQWSDIQSKWIVVGTNATWAP